MSKEEFMQLMEKDFLKMAEETYDYRSVDKKEKMKKENPKTPSYQLLEDLFEKYFRKDDVKIVKTTVVDGVNKAKKAGTNHVRSGSMSSIEGSYELNHGRKYNGLKRMSIG